MEKFFTWSRCRSHCWLLRKRSCKKQCRVSGVKVLENVKRAFKKQGHVEGSWIKLSQKTMKNMLLKRKCTAVESHATHDGEAKQYEFLADAYTGSILDVYVVA